VGTLTKPRRLVATLAISSALLPMAVLWVMLLAGWMPSLHNDDNAIYFQPLILEGQRRLWSGDLPFWKHTTLLGSPFFTDGQPGILYPGYWLAYFLADHLADAPHLIIETIAILHAGLAALGLFLLGNALTRAPLVAFALAMPLALNGFWIACAANWIVLAVNQAWTPILAWLAWRMARSDISWKRWTCAGAVAWAIPGYTGYPQMGVMNALVMGIAALSAALVARDKSIGNVLPRLFRPVLAVVLGALLAAPLWLPMYDNASESIRMGGMLSHDDAIGLSLPPSRLLGFFLPAIQEPAGNKFLYEWCFASYIAAFSALIGLVCLVKNRKPPPPGPIPSPGALYAADSAIIDQSFRPPSHTPPTAIHGWWIFGVLLLGIGLPLTLGEHLPGASILFKLPILNQFRWPFKNLFLLHLAVAVLALGGLSTIWRARLTRRIFADPRDVFNRTNALLVLALIAGWVSAAILIPQVASEPIYRIDPAEPGPILASYSGHDRLFIAAVQDDARRLPPHQALAYALPDENGPASVTGYSPIIPLRWARFIGANMFGFIRPDARPLLNHMIEDGHLFDLLGVGLIVSSKRDAETARRLQDAGYQLIEEASHTLVWKNDDPLPRAWLANRIKTYPDTESPLQIVHNGGALLRDTAIVSAEAQLHASGGTITDYREEPDRLAVRCSTPGPSYLVLSHLWDRGWRAEVDGALAFTDRAMFTLIGIEIPTGGDHIVTLDYRPARFDLGIAMSVVALFVIIAMSWRRP